MAAERICGVCCLPYDWPGTTVNGVDYCCTACSAGQACTCPQHDHRATPGAPNLETWAGAAASGAGLNPPPTSGPAGP